MYCVRCGVKLQEGEENCPLCGTPVWNPDPCEAQRSYPDTLPRHHRESDLPGAVAFTVICVIAVLVTLTVCFKLYGELNWGGYVILGIALFYVLAVLPRWARCSSPSITRPSRCMCCISASKAADIGF